MILPTKSIKLRFSIINCGAIVLSLLEENDTVSAIWERVNSQETLVNYEKYVLTLDFLFMVGAIEYKKGLIVRCSDDKTN